VIGFASGEVPAFALNLPLLKSASVVGVFWAPSRWPIRRRIRPTWRRSSPGWPRAAAPAYQRALSLARSAEAIRWVMDRKAQGKVVVEMER
jgi:NADPH2:quinone reductase